MTIMEHDYGIPSEDELARLVGAATPHFALQIRDRVVAYVTQKYGADAVARIGTFGKLLARAVVRDSGRVLGVSYGQVDRIAKLVPDKLGIKLDEAAAPGGELAAAMETDEAARRIVEVARPLEGLVRNEGVHAAGVVIAPGAVTETRLARS